MTENKNLNHTFSSDVNMPLYLIRFGSCIRLITVITVSLIVGFFFFFFCLGGGGSYVHHTVEVKIICSDVVRPSGCPFNFSVHAIFDDPVVITSRNRRHSTLMPLVYLSTGSIMLLVVMLSVRLFGCLSVCLSIIYPSVILLLVSAPYLLHQ